MEAPWVSSANNKKKKGSKMRIHKLTSTIVSLVVLGVITAALVRYRSVDAQQDRAAQAPNAVITPSATITPMPQTPGGGFNPVPAPETTSDSDTDLVLDADEVERRAVEEQASDTTATAAALSPIPVSSFFAQDTPPINASFWVERNAPPLSQVKHLSQVGHL
jgi:hypothetical protein